MQTSDDNQLMQQVKSGHGTALKILYDKYNQMIFNFLCRCIGSREIAQEFIQETFARVWFSSGTFNPNKGTFKSWIFAIALNLIRNERSKKEYSYQYVNPADIGKKKELTYFSSVEHPQSQCEKDQAQKAVHFMLMTLKPHFREVLVLKNYQYLTFTEIAEVLNIPESTAKARYHRAIDVIRAHFKKKEDRADVHEI